MDGWVDECLRVWVCGREGGREGEGSEPSTNSGYSVYFLVSWTQQGCRAPVRVRQAWVTGCTGGCVVSWVVDGWMDKWVGGWMDDWWVGEWTDG